MTFKVFCCGPIDTNSYILFCNETKSCIILDPGHESAERIKAFILQNDLKPLQIWLTHSHWDHIVDVAVLKEEYHISVGVHSLDQENLKKPGSDKLPCWVNIKGVDPDFYFDSNSKLSVGNINVEVIHTPGHTPGGVCFYAIESQLLFTGDTLFKGCIGNLSFPTAQPDLMWPSLAKLASLPPETQILPGHGPFTTIKQESWISRAKELLSSNF